MRKIFEDDTSYFSKVYYINKSVRELNADLEKISYQAYQWKIQLNPDPTKKLLKLFSLENQTQITYHIHLSNLIIMTFLNPPIKNT